MTHGQHCVRSVRYERLNKYFVVWTLRSVNESILILLSCADVLSTKANENCGHVDNLLSKK